MNQSSDDVEMIKNIKGYVNHQQSVASANFIPNAGNQAIIKLAKGRKEVNYKTTISYYDLFAPELKDNSVDATTFKKMNHQPLQDFPYEFQSISPSTGKYTLKIRKFEEKLYAEIWSKAGMLDSVDVTAKIEFIYNDTVFGSLSWSQNEESVVFVAEKKKPKTLALAEINLDPSNASIEKDVDNYLKSNNDVESFGEGLEKKVDPEVWIFDIPEKKLRKVVNINYDEIYPCYPTFYKNDKLVYTGLFKTPHKLGIRACLNRQQQIFLLSAIRKEEEKSNQGDNKTEKEDSVSADEKPVNLTPEHFLAIRPVFNWNYSKLAFLSVKEKFCEHLTAFELSCIDLGLCGDDLKLIRSSIRTLLPQVFEQNQSFNGIYSYHDYIYLSGFVGLSPEDEAFVFKTFHRGRIAIFVYDFKSNTLKVLDDENTCSNLFILDIHYRHGLLYCVASVSKLRLVKYISVRDILNLPSVNGPSQTSENKKERSCLLYDLVKDEVDILDPKLLSLYQTLQNCQSRLITLESGAEAMLLLPPESHLPKDKKIPLVLIIHGGPHGAAIYSPGNTFDTGLFLNENYAVLLPNYRGSAGFGLNFLRKTVGSAGTDEVEDVIQLIDKTLETYKDVIDPDRIGTTGFSYGGFLSCWLAVHPEFCKRLKVSIPVNPPTFLPEMVSTSDIPDWCFAESQSKERYLNYAHTEEDLLGLYKSSPVRLASNVSCAMLIVIGQADLRVPPSNGRYMYKALKHLGKKNIELLSYKGENHGIPGFEANTHFLLSLLRWFRKYL